MSVVTVIEKPFLFLQLLNFRNGELNMKQVSTERFVEKLGCDVYPITIIKFLLNRRRILSYFSKAAERDFETRGTKYLLDHSNCEACKEKESDGVLCRQHTSIERVLKATNVIFDLDTSSYLCKNEIFRMVGRRLVIIYCPHSKLIIGEITDAKVRKINPLTIEDPALSELPAYDTVHEIVSSDLMDQNMKCWFNNEFSIVTLPGDRSGLDWCLVPNK